MKGRCSPENFSPGKKHLQIVKLKTWCLGSLPVKMHHVFGQMVLAEVAWAWAVALGSPREANTKETEGHKLVRNRACLAPGGRCSAEWKEEMNWWFK